MMCFASGVAHTHGNMSIVMLNEPCRMCLYFTWGVSSLEAHLATVTTRPNSLHLWTGQKSNFQLTRQKSNFQLWTGQEPNFQLWTGQKSNFRLWTGQKSNFQLWTGQKSNFQLWTGQKSNFQTVDRAEVKLPTVDRAEVKLPTVDRTLANASSLPTWWHSLHINIRPPFRPHVLNLDPKAMNVTSGLLALLGVIGR